MTFPYSLDPVRDDPKGSYQFFVDISGVGEPTRVIVTKSRERRTTVSTPCQGSSSREDKKY